jgi:hypothetical protein
MVSVKRVFFERRWNVIRCDLFLCIFASPAAAYDFRAELESAPHNGT